MAKRAELKAVADNVKDLKIRMDSIEEKLENLLREYTEENTDEMDTDTDERRKFVEWAEMYERGDEGMYLIHRFRKDWSTIYRKFYQIFKEEEEKQKREQSERIRREKKKKELIETAFDEMND